MATRRRSKRNAVRVEPELDTVTSRPQPTDPTTSGGACPKKKHTSKEQPTTCETRKLIPVMVSMYNKEKMLEYETRMVLQSFKGRGGPLKPVGPDQYSDVHKSVVGLADKMQSWTSDEVPKEYEYGNPFLPYNLMCELPWPLRLLHDWYLRASELGLRILLCMYRKALSWVDLMQTSPSVSRTSTHSLRWMKWISISSVRGACKLSMYFVIT
uniref:Uncharacterized protein n=1 Tax=Oryza meridionalis TaxID=40149 RepID=A0A0E0DCW8_9ORYZ